MPADGNEPPRETREIGTNGGSPLAGGGTTPGQPATTAGREDASRPPHEAGEAPGATAATGQGRAAAEALRPELSPASPAADAQDGSRGTSNPEPRDASLATSPGAPIDQEQARRMAALREPTKDTPAESRISPIETATEGSLFKPRGGPIVPPVTPAGAPTDQEKTYAMAALREPAKQELLTEGQSRQNPVEAATHGTLPRAFREQGAAAHFGLSEDLFNLLAEGCSGGDLPRGESKICVVQCMCPVVAFATTLKTWRGEGTAILGVDLDQTATPDSGARPNASSLFMSPLSSILSSVVENEIPGKGDCVVAVLLGSSGRRETWWSGLEPEDTFVSFAERNRVKKLYLIASTEHEYWNRSHKTFSVVKINEFIAIKQVLNSMGLEGADDRAPDPIDAQAGRGEWGKRHEAGTRILTAVQDKDYSILYNLNVQDIEQKDYAREWTASFMQILADSVARGGARNSALTAAAGPDPMTTTVTARERLIAYFLASHFEGIPMSLFLEWGNYLCKEYAFPTAAEGQQDAVRLNIPSLSDETLRSCEIRTYSSDDRGVRVRFLGRDKMRDHFRKLFDENATIAKTQLFAALVKSNPMTAVDSTSVQRLAEVAADIIRLKGLEEQALQGVVAPLLYRKVTAGDEIHVHFVGDVEASVDFIFAVADALAARLGKDASAFIDSLWAATIVPGDALQDQAIRALLVDLPLAAVFARALARDGGLAISSRAMHALVDSSPNQSDLLLSTIWGEQEKRKGDTRGRLMAMSPKRCLELLMMAAAEIMAGRRKDVSAEWRRFCIRLFSRLLVCWIDFVNIMPEAEAASSEAEADSVFAQCGGLDKCLDTLMKAIFSRKFTGYVGHLFDQEIGTSDDEEDSMEDLAREAGRFKFEMTVFILRTLLGTRTARGLEWPALSQVARSIGGLPFEIIEMNMLSQALWVRDSDERTAIREGITHAGFPDPFRLFDRAVGDLLKRAPIYLLFALLVRPGTKREWTAVPDCAVDFLAQWRGERNNRDTISASHASYRLFAADYREGLDKAYGGRTYEARDKREQARKWMREARDELARRQNLWRTFREQGLTTPTPNAN